MLDDWPAGGHRKPVGNRTDHPCHGASRFPCPDATTGEPSPRATWSSLRVGQRPRHAGRSGRHHSSGRMHPRIWRRSQIRRISFVTTSVHQKIAEKLDIRGRQVQAAVELLDGGATVPFIARYRKEVAGALDDAQLRTSRSGCASCASSTSGARRCWGRSARKASSPRSCRRRSARPSPRHGSEASTCPASAQRQGADLAVQEHRLPPSRCPPSRFFGRHAVLAARPRPAGLGVPACRGSRRGS